ncbi:MAG: hypothetical protein J7K26_01630 [Candidatus Aenigmarchaeota archaeon]|nr:hypothetical protein [Candidatus Aenigmarchaeota archaeon]
MINNESDDNYIVEGNKIDILKEDWKYLIILDACRYDYFEKNYKKYLNNGKLRMAISPATTTMQWLNIIFSGYNDNIVYLSTNPYINSKLELKDKDGFKYYGKKHFFKVIDLWDTQWDNKLGTVKPEAMNHILNIEKKYSNKRFILHYMQPHEPYIGENYKKYIRKQYTKDDIGNEKKYSLKRKIGNLIIKFFGIQVEWKIRKFLKIQTFGQPNIIGMHEGVRGLRKAYEENLNLVLKAVSDLLPKLKGKVIITADHGEYLGENGLFGHGIMKRRPCITNVPYFEISV